MTSYFKDYTCCDKHFNPSKRINIDEMMGVNAVYESNVLRPREELGLKKGEVVEIEIIKDSIDRLSAPVRISRQDWIEELIEDQTRITAAKIKMFDLLHYIIILTNLL